MFWDDKTSTWYDDLDLPVNRSLTFKFVVDGQWRLSNDYPVSSDGDGQYNQIQIEDKFPAAKGKKKSSCLEVKSSKDILDTVKKGKVVSLSDQMKEVYLSMNGLQEAETFRIINALKGSNVEVLNLSYNIVGDKGAKLLSEILNTTKLRELYLWSTQISDIGAKSLSEAISGNTCLQILQLRANKITASGARDLAKSLKSNKTLKIFDLWYNDIKGAFVDFASVATAKSSLEELHLTAPEDLSVKDAEPWVQAFKSNPRLVLFPIPLKSKIEAIVKK
jgi:Leucine-rich repeat (LRR) protein